jgi:hypothetical protein
MTAPETQPGSDRVWPRRRRRDAVMDIEVRLIQNTLEPFTMLSVNELATRSDAALWHDGHLDAVLREAERRGVITLEPGGYVVLHRKRFSLLRRPAAGSSARES